MAEGDDPADHPERLADGEVQVLRGSRDGRALELDAEAGEQAEHVGGDGDIPVHSGDRVTTVDRVEEG